MKENIDVKVGQIWRDCDRRTPNRFLLIKALNGDCVQCENLRTGAITEIDKTRMFPASTGYELVTDADQFPELQKLLPLAAARFKAAQKYK